MKFLLIYVPNLRFKEFHTEWKKLQIGNLIKERKEYTSDFEKYPLYSFTLESGITPKSERYERSFLVKKEGDLFKIVHQNDFVMNPMNLRFGAINYSKINQIVSVSGYYDIFTIDECKYNEFWNAYFKTPRMIYTYNTIATGSLVEKKRVYFKQLKELKMYIPNDMEKNKINEFINLLNERIQTQIKIINALDSQRRCLFLKAHRAFSLKKVKIAELGRMVAVNNLSKDELSIEGYDCILYGELFTKYNLYVDNVVSKTEKMDNAIVSGGNELLFPTSTTVDAISLIKPVALIKKGVILGGDMFSIKLKDSYNPIYISCLINFIYRRKFASKTQGSTIIHLHYRDIKNEIIEICDYEVQCKIAHLIESITEKIKVEEELLNLLYLQKSYLLQNMFI